MSIEISLLIAGVSLAFAVYQGVTNMKHNQTDDDKKDAAEMTTVIVKLEQIGAGVTEIKSELKNVKEDIKENRERIIKVEESTKQAHKRLDDIHQRRMSDE